ncbi:hypothetical protein ACFXKR_38030 [Streptomyces violascens]|uniref:hypothetical protein n=1 Tax=Streptomyces violascens TaxID=67381 RepID=UPI00368C25D6
MAADRCAFSAEGVDPGARLVPGAAGPPHATGRRRYRTGRKDSDYRSVYFDHLGFELFAVYGRPWAGPLSLAVCVLRSIAYRLSREEFADLVDCASEAVRLRRRRASQLLPDTPS